MIEALLNMTPQLAALYQGLTGGSGSRMTNLENIGTTRMGYLDTLNAWQQASNFVLSSQAAVATVDSKVTTLTANVGAVNSTLSAFSTRQDAAWTTKVGDMAGTTGYKLNMHQRRATWARHKVYDETKYVWDLASQNSLEQRAQVVSLGAGVAGGGYVTAIDWTGPGVLKYTGLYVDGFSTIYGDYMFHVKLSLDDAFVFYCSWTMTDSSKAIQLHAVNDGIGELYFRDSCLAEVAISSTAGLGNAPPENLVGGSAQWGVYYMMMQYLTGT